MESGKGGATASRSATVPVRTSGAQQKGLTPEEIKRRQAEIESKAQQQPPAKAPVQPRLRPGIRLLRRQRRLRRERALLETSGCFLRQRGRQLFAVFVPKWWNWQTRHLEGVVGRPVGVRVPPSAPTNRREILSLSCRSLLPIRRRIFSVNSYEPSSFCVSVFDTHQSHKRPIARRAGSALS